jgi:hypothetical protein
MDYFIVLAWDCINEELTDEDKDKLQDYLMDNINTYKNFANLENFIAEFPSIQIEVDMDDSFINVKIYYSNFYDKLYDIIMNIYNLSNCIINYNTDNKSLEIIDASFKAIFDINNVTFVQCNITGGEFNDCKFTDCEIKNCHINNGTFRNCIIHNGKLQYCIIDDTCEVTDSYIYGGFIDGDIKGHSVIRAGKVGDHVSISNEVSIVSDRESYFGVKYDNIEQVGDGKKKGINNQDIKGLKK